MQDSDERAKGSSFIVRFHWIKQGILPHFGGVVSTTDDPKSFPR